MPTYKLTYFDIRGLAEPTRMLFAVSKTPFEDVRYPWTCEMKDGMPDFASIKNDEFKADKEAGKLEKSAGKVPFLDVDGTVVAQSKAIQRFVAGEVGMMGANNMERFQIDAVCEDIVDVQMAMRAARTAGTIQDWLGKDFPEMVGKFDKKIAGSKGFAVGAKASMADVLIYALFTDPLMTKMAGPAFTKALEGAPNMKAIVDTMGENAEMKAYLAARKDTPV